MVKESAKEQGIDLNTLDLRQGVDEREMLRDAAENHESARAAKTYGRIVNDWFDAAQQLFDERADDSNLEVQLELRNSNPTEVAASLHDSVDVIRWYQHFICVKLLRAITGACEEDPAAPDDRKWMTQDR